MNKFDRMVRRAKEKESKPKKKPKEYRYRGHYTEHLTVIPLMYFVAWYEVVRDYLNKWTFTRTEKIIKHALPKILRVDISDDSLYFTVRKYFWGFSWKWYCGIFDKYYCYKYDNRISEYFKDMFDLDGYTKSIEEDEYDDWITIVFKKET